MFTWEWKAYTWL